ncbi:MAG: HlyD family efflux transporter periplasmic adaptor subunit [Acidobacteria bacterium]|nr:HlyD family efflux transporter periplasmic adaptor subunit [Acidobacteriota bacterium]
MPRLSKKRLLLWVCLIVLIGSGIFTSRRLPMFRAKAGSVVEDLTISPRSLSFGVEATGTLRATSVKNFGAPPLFSVYWEMQIATLVPEGTVVKPGDLLVSFANQQMLNDLQKYQSEVEQANQELEKIKAQNDSQRQELVARLATAESNFEKLKVKQVTGDAALISVPRDIEKDKLALEQARREVEALNGRLEWQKSSSEAALNIVRSKKSRAETLLTQIQQRIAELQIKSDRDGVVVYKLKWNGEKFQVGEAAWPGVMVLEIPDLNTLLVDVFVPEIDIAKVKTGQRVELTIDAFPGKLYTGKVTQIGTLVRPKAWDVQNKILDVQIQLDQLDTAIMRPAMSIKAKIETRVMEQCLAVPLSAVRTTIDGSLVKVKTEAGWREQKVTLGESNGTEVVIREGLAVGDKVAVEFAKAR